MPPDAIDSWEVAEAWLTSPATWRGLSSVLLRHDAMRYRTLLLEIAQARPRGGEAGSFFYLPLGRGGWRAGGPAAQHAFLLRSWLMQRDWKARWLE